MSSLIAFTRFRQQRVAPGPLNVRCNSVPLNRPNPDPRPAAPGTNKKKNLPTNEGRDRREREPFSGREETVSFRLLPAERPHLRDREH